MSFHRRVVAYLKQFALIGIDLAPGNERPKTAWKNQQQNPAPAKVHGLFLAQSPPSGKQVCRVNGTAVFIRRAGEWPWGCRINPAFRWWCQDAPAPFPWLSPRFPLGFS